MTAKTHHHDTKHSLVDIKKALVVAFDRAIISAARCYLPQDSYSAPHQRQHLEQEAASKRRQRKGASREPSCVVFDAPAIYARRPDRGQTQVRHAHCLYHRFQHFNFLLFQLFRLHVLANFHLFLQLPRRACAEQAVSAQGLGLWVTAKVARRWHKM